MDFQDSGGLNFRAGGKNLKRIRKERGLTQEELGELAGTTSNTISRLETGSLWPALDTLIKLCNSLNVTMDAIMAPYIAADSAVRWTPLGKKLSSLPQATQDKIHIILDCLIETL